MGRVKDYFWDSICAAEPENDCEPDDLEMLQIDAERAQQRYEEALKKSAARGLSKERKHDRT